MITSNIPFTSGSTQTTSPSHTSFSSQPLSRFQKFLRKFKRTPQRAQSDSTRHSSNASYHTEQSSCQQYFYSLHPTQRHASNSDSSITVDYSQVLIPSAPATSPSGVTASPSTPATTPSGVTASPTPPATTPSSVIASLSLPATTPSGVNTSLSLPATTPSGVNTSPTPPATTPSGVNTSPPPPATTPSGVTASPPPPATTPSGVTASPLPPATTPSGVTASPSTPATAPSSVIASLSPPASTPSGDTVSPSPPATTPSGDTASPSQLAHQHSLSPAMQCYVTYLKNSYKNIKTPVYDKEHSLLQVKAKSFINIALVHRHSPLYMKDSDKREILMDRLHGHVDAIQNKKTKLHMCNVCKNKDGKLACSVLVEGAPGVGKTTFANELCKRWARGEIFWEWAAVVLIKLRDHRTRTAQNMYDLLYHPRPEVQQAVVDELIDHDGECTLLILDGYDELTDSQKESTSVIQQIMSRELLCQSTLMVTSRPLATRTLSDNFVQSIDQHIEVLGFTEKNIDEYIQSACGDKRELVNDFKSYLSSHPFSSALMFNPLQCAIVTDLYRSHWECGDKGFAPKTLTELYTGLLHIMLLRYLTQHPVYKDLYRRIKGLSDLPEEVSQQLKGITELAAEGIKKRLYVFDEDNMNIPPETLGLMQKEEVVTSGIGISTSHNFLHLTLQEYLAAVNYSQQCSSPDQLSQLLTKADLFPLNNFLQYYRKKPVTSVGYHTHTRIRRRRKKLTHSSATHWPVLLFVAGRTRLSGVPTNIFKTGLHDSNEDDNITTVNISLLHLLYETQSPQLIQSTLVTNRKYLSVSGRSVLDWFVIGYCIANSTSTWRVVIDSNDSPKYSELVMGLRLGPEKLSGECKIGSLHISGQWTGNLKVELSNLQPYAKLVTEIKLVGPPKWQVDSEKNMSMSEEVSACYPMLETLTIENVQVSYSASLLCFISQHSNLYILSLKQCNLSSIATSSLIHFLQSPNNRLQYKLTLDDCIIHIADHVNSESAAISYQLQMDLISLTATGSFSLEISGSLYAVNYILSQPYLFYANTLTILNVAIVNGTPDSLQISLYPNLATLEIVSKSKEDTAYLHSFYFSSQENNLHILSLSRCHLGNEGVSSLIHLLQSPNNRLNKLTLDDCTIQIPDHINSESAAISYQLQISPTATHFSLDITGSLIVINYILSQPHLFYANILSILKVTIVSGTTDLPLKLQIDTSLYPNLEKLDITSKEENYTLPDESNLVSSLSKSYCLFLRTWRYSLTCDTIRSLLHSLQSPHCGLQEVTLSDGIYNHTHKTTTASRLMLKPLDSGNFSLEFTGFCSDISHWLIQLSPYTQLTKLILYLESEYPTTAITLEEILRYRDMLESLKIDCRYDFRFTCLSPSINIPRFIGLQQNNLHNLSLSWCKLSSDVTWSLIHSLQSPHCRLQKLTMYNCKISIPDKTDESQQNTISTNNNTTLCSLVTTDSLCVLNHILSNVLFKNMTELSLCITTHSFSEDEVLAKIPVSCPVLETIKIYSRVHLSLPFSITLSQFIGSKQNNLHILSLSGCTLSSDVIRSFIQSLQSPHCKLHKLTTNYCTISTPDETQQNTVSAKNNTTLCSLVTTDSWCMLNHILSNVLFTQITEVSLRITTHSTLDEVLTKIPISCPELETLKIDSTSDVIVPFYLNLSLPFSFAQFIGSQQNKLHNLSVSRHILSSDDIRSLIQCLQSPHCKLYKLALYNCTIPTTDHTQLTTAIVSSTTITRLLFIDKNTDTPSLTALASGLKHNTTIEQLAVDNSFKKFTEDHFQVLIDAVDSSAIKKLWLRDCRDYKNWLSDCIVSRKNVNIEWYYNCDDLYNKW